MLIATWSVAALDFEVDSFLATVGFTPDEVWRRGETTSYGKQVETSGFSVAFEGEDSFEAVLFQLREFFIKIKPVVMTLRQRGLPSTLDFGLTVGGGKHFTRSLRFPPDFLDLLTELKIFLQVSAYPSSGKTQ